MSSIAEYGFGEGSGTTTADATGNGHTLTLNNATWTASGHTGSAIENTSANQGATGTVPSITTAVTLMAWVMPLDLAAGTTHFICGVMQGNGNTDIALFTQRGNFGTSNVLQADVRINGNLTACNGTGPLTVGTWTHVAVTYDGTAIKLYRNGVLETTTSVSGSISLGTDFYVAGALAAAGVDTDVRTDDVRYDDAALDQATIATLKDTPVAGTITGSFAVTASVSAAGLAGQTVASGTLAAAPPPASATAVGSVPVAGQLVATAPAANIVAVAATPIGGVLSASGSPTTIDVDGSTTVAGVLTAQAPAPVVALRDEGDPQDITFTITESPPRWVIKPVESRWKIQEA